MKGVCETRRGWTDEKTDRGMDSLKKGLRDNVIKLNLKAES